MSLKSSDEEKEGEERVTPSGLPVVGIGASAGGISALESLLPLLSANSGMAYVIVQHLDPARQTLLAALLGKISPLPVLQAADKVAIRPDHVYVIPPDKTLTIVDDHLLLAPLEKHIGLHTPIDSFFQSLALAKEGNCAGLILSGTGSDGTVGLRAIKEHGGLTIAQSGAEYDGMMRSAVRTGMVDLVLPLNEVPGKLQDYFPHLDLIDGRKGPDARPKVADNLSGVIGLLRARTGHDFSGYKDKTVARRVQRRMQVLQIDEVPDFIDRLRREPREVDALLQDLLIGVTNFFRDPPAFEALRREIFPKLFEGKGADDTVRVWISGCSTGEEAYSFAMLLREQTPQGQPAPKLQVFASDIDEQALQIARTGRYPSMIAGDVPPALLERYFVREDGTYRVTNDLREICLFSAHNLLRDAPFSKLDLVSCRNLLIYLTPEIQNRLIPLFHYALNDGGFLFLGSSENVSRHARLFSTIDKVHRIFGRRSVSERRLPEFPLTASDGRGGRRAGVTDRPAVQHEQPVQLLAERLLLERYAPAYVVINAEGELLHGSARTGKYLELSPGAPRIDIFSMARHGLRPELRSAVHKAVTSGQSTVQRNIVVGTNGGRQTIDLIVQPLTSAGAGEPMYMVIFQDVGGIKGLTEPAAPEVSEELENAGLRQLEMELRATKDRLHSTMEELESSNEELTSGNEELSSMNEELQSANEELETSKEELQSINEELQTLNVELSGRVEELGRVNSDVANLLESTQIATVFLDRNLAVKSFTPAAKDLFRLVESDTGRPLTHVRALFQSDTVQEDAERILRTLATIERQVESNDNDARYLMRMMPYRTVDNVIDGVVVTFANITKPLAAEARIRELTDALGARVQSLETLLDLLPVGVIIQEDNAAEEVRVNRYGTQLMGESHAHGIEPRRPTLRLADGDGELSPLEHPLYRAAKKGESVPAFEGQLVRADGSRVDIMMSATPLYGEEGRARGGILAMIDITDRRRSEAHQQILLHELQHRVKNILATITALATRMLRNSSSPGAFAQAFLGRLHAMASTHEVLSQGNWIGADLRDFIEVILRSQRPSEDAVLLKGPRVMLMPKAASTLGLLLYELATNATKYGAFSSPGGRIAITWTADPDKDLELVWDETLEPPRPAAITEGFGTGFIMKSIEYELEGAATAESTAAGLRWTLTFPMKENAQT